MYNATFGINLYSLYGQYKLSNFHIKKYYYTYMNTWTIRKRGGRKGDLKKIKSLSVKKSTTNNYRLVEMCYILFKLHEKLNIQKCHKISPILWQLIFFDEKNLSESNNVNFAYWW